MLVVQPNERSGFVKGVVERSGKEQASCYLAPKGSLICPSAIFLPNQAALILVRQKLLLQNKKKEKNVAKKSSRAEWDERGSFHPRSYL